MSVLRIATRIVHYQSEEPREYLTDGSIIPVSPQAPSGRPAGPRPGTRCPGVRGAGRRGADRSQVAPRSSLFVSSEEMPRSASLARCTVISSRSSPDDGAATSRIPVVVEQEPLVPGGRSDRIMTDATVSFAAEEQEWRINQQQNALADRWLICASALMIETSSPAPQRRSVRTARNSCWVRCAKLLWMPC